LNTHSAKVRSALALMVACASLAVAAPQESGLNEHEPAGLVEGNTRFALALYTTLARGDGNIAIAPLSISTALSMVYAGARGETQTQMGRVLGFALPEGPLNEAFGDLSSELLRRQELDGIQLSVADGLWLQRGFSVLPAFVSILEANYGAGARLVDFLGDYGASRDDINQWVASQTRGKIRAAVGPERPDPRPVLVLVNAVYFEGRWDDPFRPTRTTVAPFYLEGGSEVEAYMMRKTGEHMYCEGKLAQVVELPYSGHELSMLVVLPREGVSLHDLELTLTSEELDAWDAALTNERVAIALPRFSLDSDFALRGVLSEMGMPRVFRSGWADLSGMSAAPDLFVSHVAHRVVVQVSEHGTEAAAVTVAQAAFGLHDPPTSFRADRPFLFVIRDRLTGSILFVGRVVNPAA